VDISYLRSKRLSRDNSSIYELIDDFFKFMKNKNILINKILIFQVTSPLLSVTEIKKTLNFIQKKRVPSLFHVTKIIEHPEDCIKGLKNNWKPLNKKRIINRQNYNNNYYFITGSLFYFTKKFFEKYKVTYNKLSFAYKVDKINFIDIDSRFDLEIAKRVLNLKIRN
jgi:CMP-N,N'-diacetyllegionaminic acid synthase